MAESGGARKASSRASRVSIQAMSDLDLNDVAAFVRVVENSGFAKAARELGVPTSTVSRAVARLEEAVGVRLLHRTMPETQACFNAFHPSTDVVQIDRKIYSWISRPPSHDLDLVHSVLTRDEN